MATLKRWNGTTWDYVGGIIGPKGDTGAAGPKGDPGPAGPAGGAPQPTYVTAAHTAVAEQLVLCGTAAAGFVVTLPAPAYGARVYVKKLDAANTVTVATPSGVIDGAVTRVLTVQFSSITVVSDGTNWHII